MPEQVAVTATPTDQRSEPSERPTWSDEPTEGKIER
jgi:hypothetical protein